LVESIYTIGELLGGLAGMVSHGKIRRWSVTSGLRKNTAFVNAQLDRSRLSDIKVKK